MGYLHKRHPLYFVTHKINEQQITDLIKRLIYRLGQKEEINGGPKNSVVKQPVSVANQENKQPDKPVFKSGGALPAVEEYEDKSKLANKAKQMFDDLDDYDDDFDKSMASK